MFIPKLSSAKYQLLPQNEGYYLCHIFLDMNNLNDYWSLSANLCLAGIITIEGDETSYQEISF